MTFKRIDDNDQLTKQAKRLYSASEQTIGDVTGDDLMTIPISPTNCCILRSGWQSDCLVTAASRRNQ